MNYLIKNFMGLIWALSALMGCKSQQDALPPPSTEGLNIFACKINGKSWIANGRSNDQGPSGKPIEIEFRKVSADTFYLMIHTHADTKDRVQITLPGGVIGENTLTDRYGAPFGIYYDNQFRIFNSMRNNPGSVRITRLDTVNQVISGTFAFDAQYIVDKSIIKITEGRFDIDIRSLQKGL